MKYTHVIALAGASAAIVSAAPTPNTLSYDALVTRFGDSSASSGSGPSTGASTPAKSSKTDLEETPSSGPQSHVHHHSDTHHNSFGKGTGKGVHHRKTPGDKDRLEDARGHGSHRKQTTGGSQDLASKQSTQRHKSDALSEVTGQGSTSPQRRSFDEDLYDFEAREISSTSSSGSPAGATSAESAKTDPKEATPSSNTPSRVHHHSNPHHNSFGKGPGKGIHHGKKAPGDKDRLEDAPEHGGHRKQTSSGSQDLTGKRPSRQQKSDTVTGQESTSPQRRSFDEDLYPRFGHGLAKGAFGMFHRHGKGMGKGAEMATDLESQNNGRDLEYVESIEARDTSSASGSGSSTGASAGGSAQTDLKEETPSSNTPSHVHHHSNTHQNSFGKGAGKGIHHRKKAPGEKNRLEDAPEHGGHRKQTSGGSQDLTGKQPSRQQKSDAVTGQESTSPQRRSFDEDLYPRFGHGLAKGAFGMFHRHGKGMGKGAEMAADLESQNNGRDLEFIESIEARDTSSASGSGSSTGASAAGSAQTDLKEETPSSNTPSHVHHHSNTHHNSFGKDTGKGVHHRKKAPGEKDQLGDAHEHGSAHRKQTDQHKPDAVTSQGSTSPQRRSFDEDLYNFEAREISSTSSSGSPAGATSAESAKTDLKEATPSSNTPSRVHHHSNIHHNSFGKGADKGVHHGKKALGDKDQDAHEHGGHRKQTSGGSQDLTGQRSSRQQKSDAVTGQESTSPQRRSFDEDLYTRDLEDMEIASRDIGFYDGELSARDVELIRLAARSFVDDFELNELD